ncbi:adenylyltransferase/cytidyltransferase family protein [Halobaculum sp. D14]|uniref:adenylyltransferase/cytidyltransferase family protein n=1 Tax=Halobaculum sp. D14 TaxID=3421642 RepID=UPI003EB71C13
MTRAAFLGRFQPFHEGHHRAVKWTADRYDDVVVALGSPERSRTPQNPLSERERRDLLRSCHPELPVVAVPDEARGAPGHRSWATRLRDLTEADVVVSGNPAVRRILRAHTDVRVVEQAMHAPDRYSGTEIRRRIRAGEPWRDLVPECCRALVAEHVDVIRRTAPDGEPDSDAENDAVDNHAGDDTAESHADDAADGSAGTDPG